jgi:hypothetical protein
MIKLMMIIEFMQASQLVVSPLNLFQCEEDGLVLAVWSFHNENCYFNIKLQFEY